MFLAILTDLALARITVKQAERRIKAKIKKEKAEIVGPSVVKIKSGGTD